MRYRCLIVLLGLVAATSLSPSAALAEGSNDGIDHAPSTAAPQTGAADTAAGAFRRIKRPNAKYTGGTCVIDLSAIADFTELEEVSGCGVTVNLGEPMVKRSVPGSWATWGSPPFTETATPHVLRTHGPTTYNLTYSAKSKITGLEAEPSPFALWEISVSFLNAKGEVKGTITRTLDGEGGARLFAARTRGVKTVTITSGADFAIAQLRVKV